jgi:uncharacterized membrane protein YbaN (DUF454 family)
MTDPLSGPQLPARTRRQKIRYLVLAIFFFVLGVVGILIPVMPQFLFFAISLVFLSLVSPTVRRAMRRFLHRHPRLAHAYKRWRDRGRQRRLRRIRARRGLAERVHLSRKTVDGRGEM